MVVLAKVSTNLVNSMLIPLPNTHHSYLYICNVHVYLAAGKEKKKKKKSPISNVDTHLKKTKQRDDIESDSEVINKRIPKKKSMKNKLKSQGGRFELEEDKCKFTSA